MRMASVPRPMPATLTRGMRLLLAFSSLAKPSSLARMVQAAPSLITQMSRRVRGQATIGAFLTSWMVSFWRF